MDKFKKKIRNKEWYHQRFDGSPLYLSVITEAEVKKEKRKPAGTEANVRVCFFKDGKADWYLDMGDVRRGSEVMIRLAKKDPQISRKLLRAWKKDEQEFQKLFDNFDKINLKKLSDKELIGFYNRYYKLSINRFTSSAVIDHFALGTDKHIAALIRKEIGEFEKESDFTKIFSIATAPVHQSFINEAEMELLKMVLRHPVIASTFASLSINSAKQSDAKRHPERSEAESRDLTHGERGEISPFAYGSVEMTSRIAPRRLAAPRDDRALEKELEKYQQKYFWVKNNYIDAQILTVKHFQKEIDIWRKSGANLKAKYNQLKNTPKLNAKKKDSLFEKYKFSRLLRALIKISEDFTWWQDERKKATYLNIHMGTQILGEMARRRKIKPELTKYLALPEVVYWFKKGEPTKKELAQRMKKSAMVVWRGGFSVVTGKEVERLREIMFTLKKKDEVRDIRGLSASVGRVIGKVKVVGSVREVGKVENGDILVAVMTRPDYIAGIKKAAAIVTNEGGITCHAAIVSRELGIPCVIGTKIATEVLKDGDMVEVNANHGVVTVLKRN